MSLDRYPFAIAVNSDSVSPSHELSRGGPYGYLVRASSLGGGTLTLAVSDNGTDWVPVVTDTEMPPRYRTVVIAAKYVRVSLVGSTDPLMREVVLTSAATPEQQPQRRR